MPVLPVRSPSFASLAVLLLLCGCGGGEGATTLPADTDREEPQAPPLVDDRALTRVAVGQISGYEVAASEDDVVMSVSMNGEQTCTEVFVSQKAIGAVVGDRSFEYVERTVNAAFLAEALIAFSALAGDCQVRQVELLR